MRISKKTYLAIGLAIGVAAQAEVIQTGTSSSTYGDTYGFGIDFDSTTSTSDAIWTPALTNGTTYRINTISVRSGNTENDDLYLGVYTGFSGSTLSGFLGVSDGTVNMSGTSGGDLVSWSFANTDMRVTSEANAGAGGDQLFFMFQTGTAALTDLSEGNQTPIRRASSSYAARRSVILRKDSGAQGIRSPDYAATITVIPEPATLGMIAVAGGGLLFIRRRLML